MPRFEYLEMASNASTGESENGSWATESTSEDVFDDEELDRGQYRNVCLTLNNYDGTEVPLLQGWKVIKYGVIGKEVGESGTPHLQGYLEFKQSVQFDAIKRKLPRAHIFKRKCKVAERAAAYCKKGEQTKQEWKEEGPYGPNFGRGASFDEWGTISQPVGKKAKEPVKELPAYSFDLELYKWQQELYQELQQEPDDRTIRWLWEPDGGAGKTKFQKWLHCHLPGVLVLCGKATDMKHGLVTHVQTVREYPKIVLINIPRCQDVDHVSWQGIEEIKDMFFFSGKYEGGMVNGPSPHVCIFANEEPPKYKLSMDRWSVTRLDCKRAST